MRKTPSPDFRELAAIGNASDSRDVLAHATRQAAGSYDDYFVVDIDAHVSEDQFWSEIIELIDNDVLRQIGKAQNLGLRATTRCSTFRRGCRCKASAVASGIKVATSLWKTATAIASSLPCGAAWMRSGSTIRWCFRARCCCSACIRRMRSRSRSQRPSIAG